MSSFRRKVYYHYFLSVSIHLIILYNRLRRVIKMYRRIIEIDQEKCNGCGLCVNACHEKAIALVDGKATLVRNDYCDGLGDCLPNCPMDAIHFVMKDVEEYNEEAVQNNLEELGVESPIQEIKPSLKQWPCQIQLVPVQAPFYKNAHILIAADCTAYTFGNFHQKFMTNKVTLIGCTKLDRMNYAEKLAQIFAYNDIKAITVVKMEVPCCNGMVMAVQNALEMSQKDIPLSVITLSIRGEVLEQR